MRRTGIVILALLLLMLPSASALRVTFIDPYDRELTEISTETNTTIEQNFQFSHSIGDVSIYFKFMAIDSNDAYNNGTTFNGWRAHLYILKQNYDIYKDLGWIYGMQKTESIQLPPDTAYILKAKIFTPQLDYKTHYTVRLHMILQDNNADPHPMYNENAFFKIEFDTEDVDMDDWEPEISDDPEHKDNESVFIWWIVLLLATLSASSILITLIRRWKD